MKNLVRILSLVILMASCNKKPSSPEDLKNEKIREGYTYMETFYEEEGIRKGVESYYWEKNGIIDGEYAIFYPNGNVKEKGTFQNGSRRGDIRYYDEQGKIKEKRNYDILYGFDTLVLPIERIMYRENGEIIHNSSFFISTNFEKDTLVSFFEQITFKIEPFLNFQKSDTLNVMSIISGENQTDTIQNIRIPVEPFSLVFPLNKGMNNLIIYIESSRWIPEKQERLLIPYHKKKLVFRF